MDPSAFTRHGYVPYPVWTANCSQLKMLKTSADSCSRRTAPRLKERVRRRSIVFDRFAQERSALQIFWAAAIWQPMSPKHLFGPL